MSAFFTLTLFRLSSVSNGGDHTSEPACSFCMKSFARSMLKFTAKSPRLIEINSRLSRIRTHSTRPVSKLCPSSYGIRILGIQASTNISRLETCSEMFTMRISIDLFCHAEYITLPESVKPSDVLSCRWNLHKYLPYVTTS
jgi:hypothetical protein